jgi:hypothetical protein
MGQLDQALTEYQKASRALLNQQSLMAWEEPVFG